ncbi:MAG: extracellular solute-binding protein, partial [Clostridia bacterium]|nr:extracellular solute-binding protein [Clostridia bacterium]
VTISNLLSTMGISEEAIAKNVTNLKSYLGTLGTWINDSKTSSMTVYKIVIQSGDAKKPKAKANFFQSIGFEIKSFVMSFFIDYDNMGVTRKESVSSDALHVWVAEGRDQSKIWRSIIDGSFTENTGIPVSLKLVTASTLLPSVLARSGPDVYLGLASATVINYAIRGAIDTIRGNDDFAEAVYGLDGTPNTADDVYSPAAINTLTLLNETYGLPLTMNFPMMYYRLDALVSLGVSAPTTWDEVLALLPILQSNNLEVGITYTLALDFFLYQNGGSMWKYEDNPEYAGAQIGLDTNEGLYAFQYCTRLYTDYGMPIDFDAANRFRTGEMPLVVSDYVGVYNTLTVFATEIKGLWEFTRIPATVRADGTKNYNSIASVGATIMLHGCKDPEAAWTFMKWQTSAETEATYGNRMVALIGPSAKYAAANLGAIKLLSWTTKERDAIEEQIRHLSSIVNYPGSYIIARYTNFAFLDVVNKSVDPVDAILSYVPTINAELTRKREEFSLKTLGVGETPPADAE